MCSLLDWVINILLIIRRSPEILFSFCRDVWVGISWLQIAINFSEISLFKPSGQTTRGSSSSPALLKRSEIGPALVTETKACQLLPLCGGSLTTELSPAGAIEPGGFLDQLLAPGRILFPPLVIGHRAPIAQQIAVPVLATADAAVARLEPTDAAFHLIVGTREALPVV